MLRRMTLPAAMGARFACCPCSRRSDRSASVVPRIRRRNPPHSSDATRCHGLRRHHYPIGTAAGAPTGLVAPSFTLSAHARVGPHRGRIRPRAGPRPLFAGSALRAVSGSILECFPHRGTRPLADRLVSLSRLGFATSAARPTGGILGVAASTGTMPTSRRSSMRRSHGYSPVLFATASTLTRRVAPISPSFWRRPRSAGVAWSSSLMRMRCQATPVMSRWMPPRHETMRRRPAQSSRLGSGSWSRLRATALSATMTLDPDIEMAPISGRSTNPSGSKTPPAMGSASEL
jgi:hypothetical protein